MKILVSHSGGLDSTVLLAKLIEEKYEPNCIFFDYGSKHNKYEKIAFKKICSFYNIPYKLINLSNIFVDFNSSLLINNDEIPEGHYKDKKMTSTIVPSRNLIFLSILSGIAYSEKIPMLAIAIHKGDSYIYPDCTESFFELANKTIQAGTDNNVSLIAPFINIDKTKIVQIGAKLSVPFHLTRSCYKNQSEPCGKCGACVEREEAFKLLINRD